MTADFAAISRSLEFIKRAIQDGYYDTESIQRILSIATAMNNAALIEKVVSQCTLKNIDMQAFEFERPINVLSIAVQNNSFEALQKLIHLKFAWKPNEIADGPLLESIWIGDENIKCTKLLFQPYIAFRSVYDDLFTRTFERSSYNTALYLVLHEGLDSSCYIFSHQKHRLLKKYASAMMHNESPLKLLSSCSPLVGRLPVDCINLIFIKIDPKSLFALHRITKELYSETRGKVFAYLDSL